jgi:hypothetical protein
MHRINPSGLTADWQGRGSRRGFWRLKRHDLWQQRGWKLFKQTDNGNGDCVHDHIVDPGLFRWAKTIRDDIRHPVINDDAKWSIRTETGDRPNDATASPSAALRAEGEPS